jgi:hypothetical protein
MDGIGSSASKSAIRRLELRGARLPLTRIPSSSEGGGSAVRAVGTTTVGTAGSTRQEIVERWYSWCSVSPLSAAILIGGWAYAVNDFWLRYTGEQVGAAGEQDQQTQY